MRNRIQINDLRDQAAFNLTDSDIAKITGGIKLENVQITSYQLGAMPAYGGPDTLTKKTRGES